MSDTAQTTEGLKACTKCPCPTYTPGPFVSGPCAIPKCGHSNEEHSAGDKHPLHGVHTSVLRPVTVKNTGNKVLVFVADEPQHNFKLAPGETRHLAPGNYRVQVDFTKPPIVIVIAKIVYDRKLKRFDIQAEDGLEGARFVTNVDLEAVGKLPHHAAEA